MLASLLANRPVQVVDVGARDGVHPRWNRFRRVVEAIGFEADEQECHRLNAERGTDGTNLRFLPFALASTETVRSFNQCRAPGYSGLYEPNYEFTAPFASEIQEAMQVVNTATVRTTTLDAVAASERLHPDVLKIDVQGAELEILLGGRAVLSDVKLVELEVEFNPQYRNQPLFADVDVFMREQGFALLGLRRTFWRRNSGMIEISASGGQIVHGDVLYYNRRLLDDGHDARPHRDLAAWVLSLSVYRQDDFAAHLLANAAGLDSRDIAAIAGELHARPRLTPRLLGGVLRLLVNRLGHRRARALVDECRRRPAIDWHDPDFF